MGKIKILVWDDEIHLNNKHLYDNANLDEDCEISSLVVYFDVLDKIWKEAIKLRSNENEKISIKDIKDKEKQIINRINEYFNSNLMIELNIANRLNPEPDINDAEMSVAFNEIYTKAEIDKNLLFKNGGSLDYIINNDYDIIISDLYWRIEHEQWRIDGCFNFLFALIKNNETIIKLTSQFVEELRSNKYYTDTFGYFGFYINKTIEMFNKKQVYKIFYNQKNYDEIISESINDFQIKTITALDYKDANKFYMMIEKYSTLYQESHLFSLLNYDKNEILKFQVNERFDFEHLFPYLINNYRNMDNLIKEWKNICERIKPVLFKKVGLCAFYADIYLRLGEATHFPFIIEGMKKINKCIEYIRNFKVINDTINNILIGTLDEILKFRKDYEGCINNLSRIEQEGLQDKFKHKLRTYIDELIELENIKIVVSERNIKIKVPHDKFKEKLISLAKAIRKENTNDTITIYFSAEDTRDMKIIKCYVIAEGNFIDKPLSAFFRRTSEGYWCDQSVFDFFCYFSTVFKMQKYKNGKIIESFDVKANQDNADDISSQVEYGGNEGTRIYLEFFHPAAAEK